MAVDSMGWVYGWVFVQTVVIPDVQARGGVMGRVMIRDHLSHGSDFIVGSRLKSSSPRLPTNSRMPPSSPS